MPEKEIQLRLIGGLYVAEDIKKQNYALLNLKLNYEIYRYGRLQSKFLNKTL